MPFITPFPSFKTALGIHVEATAGTFVAPANYIPILPPKIKDEFGWYEDKSYRATAAESYGRYQLVGKGGVQFDGPFYPDSAGYFLYGATGIDTITVAPAGTTTTGTNNSGQNVLNVTSGTGYVNGAAILIAGATPALAEGGIILSGGGTSALTLYAPLRYTHNAGATVTGNTLHKLSMGPTATPVPTFSLWDQYGEAQKNWTYAVVESFDLKWNVEKEVTYSSSLVCLPSVLGGAQTVSTTTVTPFTGWMAQPLVGGSAIANCQDIQANIKRKVMVLFAGNNQNTPVAIVPTTLAITGKMLMWLSSEAELNHYRQADNPAIALSMFGPSMGVAAAQSASGLVLQMTNANYTLAEVMRTKDVIEVAVDFASDYSAADAGPYACNLTNAYTTNYSAI